MLSRTTAFSVFRVSSYELSQCGAISKASFIQKKNILMEGKLTRWSSSVISDKLAKLSAQKKAI
jgi:hypothetical protein